MLCFQWEYFCPCLISLFHIKIWALSSNTVMIWSKSASVQWRFYGRYFFVCLYFVCTCARCTKNNQNKRNSAKHISTRKTSHWNCGNSWQKGRLKENIENWSECTPKTYITSKQSVFSLETLRRSRFVNIFSELYRFLLFILWVY